MYDPFFFIITFGQLITFWVQMPSLNYMINQACKHTIESSKGVNIHQTKIIYLSYASSLLSLFYSSFFFFSLFSIISPLLSWRLYRDPSLPIQCEMGRWKNLTRRWDVASQTSYKWKRTWKGLILVPTAHEECFPLGLNEFSCFIMGL